MAIGLAGAIGFTRLMESLVFGISPLDPITFTAMSIVLAAAAALGQLSAGAPRGGGRSGRDAQGGMTPAV